jgi:hypothetical protein
MNWSFPTEREVQWAKSRVANGRRHPFVHLFFDSYNREQVKQLAHRLGIAENLNFDRRAANLRNTLRGRKHIQQTGCCK